MLLPLFLIAGLRLAISEAGWILAFQGIGMLFLYPMVGFLTGRFGCRAVSAGGGLLVIIRTLPMLAMSLGSFRPFG